MSTGRSRLSLALRLLGGLCTLGAVVVAVLGWRAGAAMDARAASVRARIEARRAGPTERPVLLGAPLEANAVDEYRGVEWVLGPGARVQPWPTMVRPALERDHPAANGLDLGRSLTAAFDALERGEAPPTDAAQAVETYASVLEQVRRGLRSTRCDWQVRLEDGLSVEVPALPAARQAAQLLALSALREQDAREAARRGLEVVAYGRDLGRHGSMIASMIGAAVESVGLRSLERTLRARALPRAGYEEVLAVLGRVEPIDLAALLDAERLAMEAELARLCGRAPSRAEADLLELPAISRLPGVSSIFWDREWRGYVEQFGLVQAAAAAPPAERAARLAAAQEQVGAAGLALSSILVPDVAAFQAHVASSQALRQAARVLAAAHLHRLDAGAFPAGAAALAPLLGGALPADPHSPTGAPLVFEVVDGEARCYSVGDDGVDDGGEDLGATTGGADVGLRTRVPAH